MNDTTITIRGNAGSVPELRTSATGVQWTSFRLASTSRRRTPAGTWEDKATMWVNVTVFRGLAERVAATVRKGTPLTIVGDLSHEEWVGSDGVPRSNPALTARSVAIDLTGGKVYWTRSEQPSGEQPAGELAAGGRDATIDPGPLTDEDGGPYEGPGEPEDPAEGGRSELLTLVRGQGEGGDEPPF